MITRRRWLQSSVATLLLPKVGFASSAFDSWQPLPNRVIYRVAFGSCAKQWEPQPIWGSVAAAEPDLFLFLGDNIYGDWHGDKPFVPTAESLRADYRRLAEKPEFAMVQKQIPFMATWDNHDYGKHDGGAEFELKEMARRVFLDFFGEPTGSPRRQREGIYDARLFGPEGRRVQVIMLDNRWNRGALIPDVRSKVEREDAGQIRQHGPYPERRPGGNVIG